MLFSTLGLQSQWIKDSMALKRIYSFKDSFHYAWELTFVLIQILN